MSYNRKHILGKVLTAWITLFFLEILSAFGHEFWLLPNHFYLDPSGEVIIRLQVGENFSGNNWTGNKANIQQLTQTEPLGRSFNLETLIGDAKGDSIHLSNLMTGTHMVIYHSAKSFIELQAREFNDYLAEDGLDEALAYRKAHGEFDQPAKENYQRCAKTIFYAGKPTDAKVNEPTTLPLDIVPNKNVYAVSNGLATKMRFTVYFKGMPLANANIKSWHKLANGTVEEKQYRTDKKGRVKLDVIATGTWMLSTVKMQHNGSAEVPWQSYWGSLTWGYQ